MSAKLPTPEAGCLVSEPNLNALHPLTAVPWLKLSLPAGKITLQALVAGYGFDLQRWEEVRQQFHRLKAAG